MENSCVEAKGQAERIYIWSLSVHGSAQKVRSWACSNIWDVKNVVTVHDSESSCLLI